MKEGSQFYLVDSESVLASHWPGRIFFLGTTHNTLIYQSNSPISKVVSLPEPFAIVDIPLQYSKHGLGEWLYSISAPVLCVANPFEIESIESGLENCGLIFTLIDAGVLQLDPELTLDELNKIGMRGFHSPLFIELPSTNPIIGCKMIPYIDHKCDLVIPQCCDPVWKWWLDGLTPNSIIQCFASVVEPELYQKICMIIS
jgi:hypothetical protein